MALGISIYEFIEGKDAPLTRREDREGPTRIVPPKEQRESAEREQREEQRRREESNQRDSGGVERPGLRRAGRPGYADGGKVEKVMGEFKRGTLHSGSPKGPRVTSRKQATAIAMSEARRTGQYANGGEVEGPGGPTDDMVPIDASDGEYVIPADVVRFLGTGFFDRLVQQAQMKMGAGAQPPGPWDEMAQDGGGAMVPGGMAAGRRA